MRRQLVAVVAIASLAPTFMATRSLANAQQGAQATAAAPDHEHHAAVERSAEAKPMTDMRRTMMEKMRVSDAAFDRLVVEMKAATGDTKIALMADLLSRIVQHETTMHQEMQESMKTMMAQCPMMKDTGTHEHEP